MKTNFFIILILVLAVTSCNRNSLDEPGNVVITIYDGAGWCIMPDATITNPEIKEILTDSVIPFLKKNFYSPKNYYISIWNVAYKDDDLGNIKKLIIHSQPKSYYVVGSEESYKNEIVGYTYIDDYLIELCYLKGKGIDPFFETGENYLAFKNNYKEMPEGTLDDSIFFIIRWSYLIKDGKMYLYETNDMEMIQTYNQYFFSNDTIYIRPVNENKEILF